MVASGIIMSLVGFAVAGQFVSLGGLEIPYYVAMIGVVLLKYAGAAAPQPDLALNPVRGMVRSPQHVLPH